MSGPNPPGWEPEEPDAAGELRHGQQSVSEPGEELAPTEIDSHDELEPHDDSSEIAAADHTGQTDAYSQAYSAPESEHFITGPYVPADLRLYDYDGYDDSADADDEHRAPRWPWVVGVAAIVAAIALVVSVTVVVAPGDIISVTYVDASGRSRTQHNVYIPWSMTVTPISQSDVGSVQASSLFRVSRLNCSITTSDGAVLSSNNNDAPQTSC